MLHVVCLCCERMASFLLTCLSPFFSLGTWLIRFSLPCALLSCLSVVLSTWLLLLSHCLFPNASEPHSLVDLFSYFTCLPHLTLDFCFCSTCLWLCGSCASSFLLLHLSVFFFLCVFSGSRLSVQVLVLGLSSALQGAFCLFNIYNPIYLLDLANDF